MIGKEELLRLKDDLENDRVEKTVTVSKKEKFGEAICAFSNDLPDHRKPGYILIGVNDDGSLSGLKVTERIIQTLLEFRTDGRIVPPPSLSVRTFSFPEGEVLAVEVYPSFHPPVRFKNRVWIRIGPRRNIASEEEERRLSEKRSLYVKSFDTTPCLGSSLEDMSLEIFKLSYLPRAIDQRTLEENHRDPHTQLASLKFYDLRTRFPTHAGILMFGIDPRSFLHGAYVQYVRFTGEDETSEFDFEKRFQEDLTSIFRAINEFIKVQIVRSVQNELGAEYVHNYPLIALQELIFNALIHRDYKSNAPIKFYEFSNRVEIINPGGLFGNARPSNFPNTNDYRNPIIAEAAKTLGWVNKFNVGVKRAIKALEANGNPSPKFITNQVATFGVIIYKKP